MYDVAGSSTETAFLQGGGGMGLLMRSHDWSASPLGDPSGWPDCLRAAVAIVLHVPTPMALLWGDDGVMLYNDGYAEIAGSRHPDLLGAKVLEAWPEIDDFNSHILNEVLEGGTLAFKDQELTLHRNGSPEQVYLDLNYSPVMDQCGRPAGVLAIVVETTKQVLAERHKATERQRLARMFEQAPSFMALLRGPDHVFELTNASYRQLIGHRDVIDRPVAEVLPEVIDQGFIELLDRVRTTGEPFVGQAVPITLQAAPDSPPEERLLDFVYQPIVEADGRVDGIFVEGLDVTERVRADQARQTSEAQFRAFAQAVPNHVWAAWPDGQLFWFNDQVYAYSGARQGTLDEAGWADIVHPEDSPNATTAWAEALATGQAYETEFRIRQADGVYRWFLARAEPVRDTSGAITSWIGTNTDIDERRRAEEDLRNIAADLEREVDERRESERRLHDSQQRLQTALEVARLGTFDWNVATGAVEVDARTREIFDLEAEGPVRQEDIFGRIAPKDASRVQAEAWAAMETGDAVTISYDVLRPDGSRRSIESHGNLRLEAADGAQHMIGLFHDVTAIRRAEAMLREENENLEQRVKERTRELDRVWRLSQDLLVIAEPDGTLNAVNEAWSDLLGWSDAELVGATFMQLAHPDDLEDTLEAFAGILEAPLSTPYEYRLRHKDGSYRWFAWTAAFEDGAIYANGRDVTAQKAQTEALIAAEDALRQSQKMEAVGQLTGGLAHDFNNLLAGISGSLEIMSKRVNQGRYADVDRYLSGAQGAARRAAALTHRLLAFSRRQTLDPKVIDANALMAGLEELVSRTAGPAVDIKTIAGADLWMVKVDPNQLENTLLNLCLNARDAMPEGGRITIETAKCHLDEAAARELNMTSGEYVSLCVSDTGTGMAPEVVARAFEPFFTTKPIGVGTGLGLSMTYGFAQQSGGQVRIDSEVGQGTTICLYLPRHLGTADVEPVTHKGAPPGAAEQTGQTVLVIDDEPLVRMLVVDVLADLGYDVLEASDGVEGLKLLRSAARIDLLITDVGLPNGLNGRQVADAARDIRPGLNVLFITGYAENAVLNHGHLEPGMQIVTKPFEMMDLGRRIQALMPENAG